MASSLFSGVAAVSCFLLLLLLHPSASLTHSSTQTASDAASRDHFGTAVAATSTLLIVGSPEDDATYADQGSAYLFNCTSLPCTQLTKLQASDAGAGDFFGWSVAISSTTVVAGSPIDDTIGSAYLFDCTSLPCTQLDKLTPSDGAADDEFGQAVAISGNLVAVGSPNSNSDGGAVYIFDCSSLPCTQVNKLTVSLTTNLGYSLAFSGTTLIAGAIFTTVGSNAGQGAAYLFDCSSGSCTLGATLTASDGVANAQFGISVSINGNLIAVGALQAGSPTYSGGVYIFECTSPSSCTQKSKLKAPDAASGDLFGSSVAISGSVVAIGAPSDNTGSTADHGSGYLFDCLNASSCTYVAKLTASDQASSDELGTSIATLGWRVAAGVPYDRVTLTGQGSVKIFDATSAICNCSPTGSSGTGCGSDRQCTCNSGWTGLRCDTAI